jgi:hypothetical protein
MEQIREMKDSYVRFRISGQEVHIPFARAVVAYFSELTSQSIQRQ